MYFLTGRQGRPFPTYILENLKCSFIPTALLVKLWQLTLPFLFPHVLMGCELGQRENLTSKGPFSKVVYTAHLTKSAPHSYHAKIIAVIIWMTIWFLLLNHLCLMWDQRHPLNGMKICI